MQHITVPLPHLITPSVCGGAKKKTKQRKIADLMLGVSALIQTKFSKKVRRKVSGAHSRVATLIQPIFKKKKKKR